MKRKFTYFIVALMMTMVYATTATAAAIQQIGDRYIIHIDELNLSGEETLAEVLAMFPNVIDFRGEVFGANATVRVNDYGLSTHNMGYTGDYEQFLEKTKAKELDRIQVCTMAGTMKGTEGVGKVIDVYFKKGKNGTSGRVSVKADSYGSLTSFNTVKVERDNLTVWGQLMGGFKHKMINDLETHTGNEAAVVGFDWHINETNKLMANVNQSFYREHDNSFDTKTFSRDIDVNIVYDLDLFDKRGYMEIQTVFLNLGDNSSTQTGGEFSHGHYTIPVGVIEFGIPLYKDKALLMAGIEGGLTKYTENVLIPCSDRQLYYDVYGQIDWNIHGLNISIGDRVRTNKYYQNENEYVDDIDPDVRRSADHRHRNHFFNFALYGNITKHSVLKGAFAKAPMSPIFQNFLYQDDPSKDYFEYRSSVQKMDAYISELKYEYQKPDFTFTTFINNSHTNFTSILPSPGEHGNIFQVGASTYWHKGILRLAGALNYYNVMDHESDEKEYSNIIQVRLQPSISLLQGWQIVPLLSYSSFARLYGMGQPAQFNASLRVTKSIKNWDFDLVGNNLGHQRFGHRSVALGITYNW